MFALHSRVKRKDLQCLIRIFAVFLLCIGTVNAKSVSNTATVTNPDDVTCTSTGANTCAWSASDTDDVESPELNLSKKHSDTFAVGSTADYVLQVSNTGKAATYGTVTITDTLPNGMSYVSGSGTGWSCSASGQTVTCTSSDVIAANASGQQLTLRVSIEQDAYPKVSNSASVSGGGDASCPAPQNSSSAAPARCGSTDDTNVSPASTSTVTKSVDPKGPVLPGSELTYTLQLTVSGSNTTEAITLSDTPDQQVDFESIVDVGQFQCQPPGNALVCTLPAGKTPDTYSVSYKVKLKDTASGSIDNQVVPSTPDGKHTPSCQTCTTHTAVTAPSITVSKSVDPQGQVKPGDTLHYTLQTVVQNSKTTEILTLNDTLGKGLTFGKVTNAGAYSCHDALVCELPAGTMPGTYTVQFTATVNADASGNISNSLTATNPDGGDPAPTCSSCTASNTVIPTSLSVRKEVSPTGTVLPGALLTYTLTTEVKNSATTQDLTLTDTLGQGLQFEQITNSGAYTCHDTVVCVLPAGTVPGTYRVSFTARVKQDATGGLTNSLAASNPDGGDPEPTCDSCTTSSQVAPTGVSVSKSVTPSGTVAPGSTLTYALDVVVSTSATTQSVVLNDTLGKGLQFDKIVNAGQMHCHDTLVCELPAGALPGRYTVTYTAIVQSDATGTADNSVVPSKGPGSGTGGGNDPDPVCSTCSTQSQITPAAIAVSQSSDAPSGSEITPNQDIHYQIQAVVSQAYTTGPVTMTASLHGPIHLTGPLPSGCTQNGQNIVCVLPAGTPPGTYTFPYTAKVDGDATGAVSSTVTPQGQGATQPTCTNCTSQNPLVPTKVRVSQKSDIPDGTPVTVGQQIHHTIMANVTGSATTSPTKVTQTFGPGMKLVGPVPKGCVAIDQGLECTLPAGALPGDYDWSFATEITDAAPEAIRMHLSSTGGVQSSCVGCNLAFPLLRPVITVQKSADPENNMSVSPGQTITYTLSVVLGKSQNIYPVVLDDTLSANQTLVMPLPKGCSGQSTHVLCTLPGRSQPGTYTFVYKATVNADASGKISNAVVPSGADHPLCDPGCTTQHPIANQWQIRLLKSVAVHTVHVGDVVRYTLALENVGDTDFHGVIADTLPAGFAYANGSLISNDMDQQADASGTPMLRITHADIAAHAKATFTYQVRVGAGVRPGAHINTAMVTTLSGAQASNISTASVTTTADAMLDDSLIFGTVFDDRDADGWQDSAAITSLKVKGGFAQQAYRPGTTTVDRGNGPHAQADASAPMLHGIALGTLDGRQSEVDPASQHQIVIHQRLQTLQFTNDFVVTTAQGITVHMDAAGRTKTVISGQAQKGRNAAQMTVQRQVKQLASNDFAVDYIITNTGIEERGIAGVRLGTVEGLIIETDQFGRYHIEAVSGGNTERGRNYIVKVDPTTLAKGAFFTTENPLVRRITPGLPVRFDFGIKMPTDTPEKAQQSLHTPQQLQQPNHDKRKQAQWKRHALRQHQRFSNQSRQSQVMVNKITEQQQSGGANRIVYHRCHAAFCIVWPRTCAMSDTTVTLAWK